MGDLRVEMIDRTPDRLAVTERVVAGGESSDALGFGFVSQPLGGLALRHGPIPGLEGGVAL